MKPFANEPILELRRAPVRAQLHGALQAFDAQPVLRVPVWIGGDRREGAELISTDPGNPERVVAEAAVATEAEVDAALGAAQRGFTTWGRKPAVERAAVLAVT
jgi:RHH-type transcriptional regulator, proline utilization regulon repressor / proline dehydrogenase / delta 1-pyrroline-5-carboxylate dehydrogenase